MARIKKTIFQIRKGLSEDWKKKNPVLRNGEPSFETDTFSFKIGNGILPYKELPYVAKGSALEADLFKRLADLETGFEDLLQRVAALEKSPDQKVITTIMANGLPLTNTNGKVYLPNASQTLRGIVKGSFNQNCIKVLSDGSMEVNKINITKITQTPGEEFIIKG